MIRKEYLPDALDSLGLGVLGGAIPAPRAPNQKFQLTFARTPFGEPVTYRQAWALVRLLRAANPATRATFEKAIAES